MDQDLRDRDFNRVEEPLLTLTDTAVTMIKQVMERVGMRDGGVRMTVAGGGCRGFQYSLQLAEEAQTDDEVVVQKGITAFLDPVSAQHLRGTLLDYVNNRHGKGFHFFQLNAAHTIGCGSSILLRRCINGNTRTTGCIQSAKRPLMELSYEVAQPSVDNRSSISHPNLRPRSICPTCHYVICRCEKTA